MGRTEDDVLTADDVFRRYRWKRTKRYRMLNSPGFPRRIGGVLAETRAKLEREAAVADAAVRLDRPLPVKALKAQEARSGRRIGKVPLSAGAA